MNQHTPIDVVAGIVYNENGEFLLTSRPEGKPYAGYWEFAGGKVEIGETLFNALQREFTEELGITVHSAIPWLCKTHVYEHATVRLHFFRITSQQWSGKLTAREGQQWAWQKAGAYSVSPMLPANHSLLFALEIPASMNGNLQYGFSCGNFNIVPHNQATESHLNILYHYNDLPKNTTLPSGRHIWIAVHTTQQFSLAQDADAILWHVQDDNTAQELLHILQQGVSLPIAAYANHTLCRRYATQWRSYGLHTIIENQETVCV